jgi:glutathione S-transferase
MAGQRAIKIWGRSTSSNVKKALVVADELGVAYERIDAGGKYGGLDTPQYRKLNPNMRIPTIEDGDFVLWESNSIMRYLAMKYGGAAIYPADPARRASIDRWLDWQLSTLLPADSPVFWGTIRTPVEKHDKKAIAEGMKKLNDVLAILNNELAGKQYLTGQLSLADLALGIFVHRYFANPFIEQAEFAHLKAWFERLRQRPSYKKHVDVPLE